MKRVPFVVIDHPQTDQNESVVPSGMPGMPGKLCWCSGSLNYATRTYISAIYIKNSRGSATPPSEADTISYYDWMTFVGDFYTTYPWNADSLIPAFYEANPAADNNALRVLAQYYIPGTAMLAPDTDAKPFKGKTAANCGRAPADKKTKIALTTERVVINGDGPAAAASPLAAETRISPTRTDEGWLLYQGFSVAFVGAGNVLMRHGQPLKATRIAVSGRRVAWWHGISPARFVSRPGGDGMAQLFHRFPAAAPNAIVVWQKGSPLVPCGIVTSECREHPDVIDVDPGQEIRIQVNASIVDADALNGSFELWVKVID
jgi:hypothetical protein